MAGQAPERSGSGRRGRGGFNAALPPSPPRTQVRSNSVELLMQQVSVCCVCVCVCVVCVCV